MAVEDARKRAVAERMAAGDQRGARFLHRAARGFVEQCVDQTGLRLDPPRPTAAAKRFGPRLALLPRQLAAAAWPR